MSCIDVLEPESALPNNRLTHVVGRMKLALLSFWTLEARELPWLIRDPYYKVRIGSTYYCESSHRTMVHIPMSCRSIHRTSGKGKRSIQKKLPFGVVSSALATEYFVFRWYGVRHTRQRTRK